MSGLDPERLCDSVSVVTSQAADIANGRAPPLIAPRDYMIEDVARKVVRIILSYIRYVDRTVWSK
jgi:UDP-N-acetylglucosamine 2-epimerase (non-hydrolysing)